LRALETEELAKIPGLTEIEREQMLAPIGRASKIYRIASDVQAHRAGLTESLSARNAS
jgi:hypothetical protein